MRAQPGPSSPRSRRTRRRSILTAAAGATVFLAACGGADSTSTDAITPADTSSDTVAADVATEPSADSDTESGAAVASGPGHVDLVGTDVVSSAEIETNKLPSVVLDDVSNGRKVNFRNLVPQEKPILLWMYAPH